MRYHIRAVFRVPEVDAVDSYEMDRPDHWPDPTPDFYGIYYRDGARLLVHVKDFTLLASAEEYLEELDV
jgi:hypothetical protein